jgi:hypothetical protein
MFRKLTRGIRRVSAVILVLMLVLTVTGSVWAGSTTKTLSTNFTLINLDPTNVANGAIQYLKDSGAAWPVAPGNDTFNLAANGGSVQIKQYFDNTMTSGRGSAIVSSDAPVGAVVQIHARGQTPSQGAYSGFQQGSNMFYVPLAAKQRNTASGVANSQIVIQNAGTAAITATIQMIPSPGITGSYTKIVPSLAVGVSYYYDLADELDANLPSGWIGSAVVTGGGGGLITVISNFFTGPDTMQTFNGFSSADVGTSWLIPTLFVRLSNGLNTVVAVQNLSGGEIPIGGLSLTCNTTKGSTPASFTRANPAAIANSASYSFNPATDTTLFPNSMAPWEGSCVVSTTSANIVALAQLRYVNSPSGNIGAAAYEAIKIGGTNKKMFVPLVAKRLLNGFASVVTIQNLSTSAAANVTLYYVPATNGACPVASCDKNGDGFVTVADTYSVGPLTIPAGVSIQRNHRLLSGGVDSESTLPDNWEGALRVESSDQAIDGYVQLTFYMNVSGDQFMAHRGFTVP